ncbi:unnamed protein product [Pedinophyceae sp. YPF-701]|nr:unnamed protein product [Pedinophyceae sp. YPF-701]
MGGCFSAPSTAQPASAAQQDAATDFKAVVPQDYSLFFPIKAMPCRWWLEGKGCKRQDCQYWHDHTSLTRLLRIIDGAKATLDVCVFTITCNEIANAVTAAHRRGVRVRIITDDDQSNAQGSDIKALRQAGIPVRMDKSCYHMHHKFCVVDGERLVTGSFNWTRQACLNNQVRATPAPGCERARGTQGRGAPARAHGPRCSLAQENVVVLHGPKLVKEFTKLFDKLWADYRP